MIKLIEEYNKLEKEVEKDCAILCSKCTVADKCNAYANLYETIVKSLRKELKADYFYFIYNRENPLVIDTSNGYYEIYMSAGHTYCIDDFEGNQILNTFNVEEVVKTVLF